MKLLDAERPPLPARSTAAEAPEAKPAAAEPASWPITLALVGGGLFAISRVWRAHVATRRRAADHATSAVRAAHPASEVPWEIDRAGRFVRASGRLAALLGEPAPMPADRGLVAVLDDLCLPEARIESLTALQSALAMSVAFRDVALPVVRMGGVRWWSIAAKPLVDDAGAKTGWRGLISDVTLERRAAADSIDALTGIANRARLRERIAEALERPGDPPRRCALLAIDIDDFESINLAFGRDAGDEVLKTVARRLHSQIRHSDALARVGGDEFAVMLDDVRNFDEVPLLARRMVAAMAAPCDLGSASVSATVSVGVALMPDHGATVDEVMRHAALALRSAKAAGGRRAEFFAPRTIARGWRRSPVDG